MRGPGRLLSVGLAEKVLTRVDRSNLLLQDLFTPPSDFKRQIPYEVQHSDRDGGRGLKA